MNIQSVKDLLPYLNRASETAVGLGVMREQILSKNRKALVIYVSDDFFDYPTRPGTPPATGLKDAINRDRPGAMAVILPYIGYPDPKCSVGFETDMKLPVPALASAPGGLKPWLARAGCEFQPRIARREGAPAIPPELEAVQRKAEALSAEIASGGVGDALLYLGPAGSLIHSPLDPSILLDTTYFKEVSRRYKIQTGQPATEAEWAAEAARGPYPYTR